MSRWCRPLAKSNRLGRARRDPSGPTALLVMKVNPSRKTRPIATAAPGCGIGERLRGGRSAGESQSRGGRSRRNLRSVDKDQRWAALVEQFDPLPQELADLIHRDETGEVLSWIRQRLNASQRDLDDFRFGNPRLFAQLRDALKRPLERPGEGSAELNRYREEWERRAQVCYTWLRRLLAASEINRESSFSVLG